MPPDTTGGRCVAVLSLALMLLASVAVDVTALEGDRQGVLTLTLLWAGQVPLLVLVWWLGRREAARGQCRKLPALPALCLLGLTLLPHPVALARQAWVPGGLPLEVLLLAGLRNLGLGLALLPRWLACTRLAALVSLFLMLVASALALGSWVKPWTALYAVTGSLWLVAAYWGRLRLSQAATERFPLSAVGLVVLTVGSATLLAVVGPQRAAALVHEWFPSSGGSTRPDDSSRGGLGDGDDVVKAMHNPKSTGMTDSDQFLDAHQPSLYDVINDVYGKPFKSDVDKAIALDVDKQPKSPRRVADHLRASREFPLQRERPPVRSRLKDVQAQALLYVQGPVPLHLRLEAYDRFDGRAWHVAPPTERALTLKKEPESTWFRVEDGVARPYQAGRVSHEIKIAALTTTTLPAPADVERLRVGKLFEPRFFAYAQDDLLRMTVTVPPGTILETHSRTTDQALLQGVPLILRTRGQSRHQTLPADWAGRDAVTTLAQEWTRGIPEGWGQVDAIVRRLRAHAVHDREYRPATEAAGPVGHFLGVSRRGPSYDFASAAALLLRSLGYATRLVSGFYADPQRYDAATDHTQVHEEDAHFWVEVRLPSGAWVAVEPTPGYELLAAAYPWYARLWQGLCDGWQWVRQHPWPAAALVASLGLLFLLRHRCYDLGQSLWWRLRPGRTEREMVLRTLRLLDRRARWSGRPRPACLTLRRWYATLAHQCPREGSCLHCLAQLADWALYAPAQAPAAWPGAAVRQTCQHAVRHWTMTRCRAAAQRLLTSQESPSS